LFNSNLNGRRATREIFTKSSGLKRSSCRLHLHFLVSDGAMGATLNLLIGGPALLYCVLFALVSVFLQTQIPYKTYSNILKWWTFSLVSYVGTIFVVQIDWGEMLRGTLIPTISFEGEYLAALIAVSGTTISPYLLFWQSGEEVEQMESEPKEKPLKKIPQEAPGQFQRTK
jgi:Mn2+/Fe2+ NRAMP family transporter